MDPDVADYLAKERAGKERTSQEDAAPVAEKDVQMAASTRGNVAVENTSYLGNSSVFSLKSSIGRPPSSVASFGSEPSTPATPSVGVTTPTSNANEVGNEWELAAKKAIEAGLWKERKHADGRTYFVNVKEKRSCWNLAKELKRLALGETPSAAASPGATSLSAQPSAPSTPATKGLPTPSPSPPRSTPLAASVAAKKALADGTWKEKKHPDGRTYFVNVKEKRSCWNLDKELAVA